MSSVDLHTHVGYQIMLPEAIAIVCSPSKQPRYISIWAWVIVVGESFDWRIHLVWKRLLIVSRRVYFIHILSPGSWFIGIVGGEVQMGMWGRCPGRSWRWLICVSSACIGGCIWERWCIGISAQFCFVFYLTKYAWVRLTTLKRRLELDLELSINELHGKWMYMNLLGSRNVCYTWKMTNEQFCSQYV
jgi:hypothetical protein